MPKTFRLATILWCVVALLWLVAAATLFRAFNGYLSHTGQVLPFLAELGLACGSAHLAYAIQRRPEAPRRTALTFGVVSLGYALMLVGFLPAFGLMPYVFPMGMFGVLLPLATSALSFTTARRSITCDPIDEIPRRGHDSF